MLYEIYSEKYGVMGQLLDYGVVSKLVFSYEGKTHMPLYAENIGSSVLYIRYEGYSFRLGPGERKELVEQNASKDIPDLPNEDLYPAGIVE